MNKLPQSSGGERARKGKDGNDDEKRRYSFGETISARREFFARIKQARKREINNRDHCQRPKPACQTACPGNARRRQRRYK